MKNVPDVREFKETQDSRSKLNFRFGQLSERPEDLLSEVTRVKTYHT